MEIKKQLAAGDFTKDILNYPNDESSIKVVNALLEFLANSTTAVEMGDAFDTLTETVSDADLKAAFDQESYKGDLRDLFVEYLVDVQTKVLSTMDTTKGSQADNFIDALFGVYHANTDYTPIKDGVNYAVKKLQVGLALNEIVSSEEITQAHKDAFKALAKEYKTVLTPPEVITPPGVVIPPTPPTTGDNAVEVDGSTIGSNPQATIDAIEKADKVDQLVVKVQAGTTVADIPATILNALSKKNSNAVVVLQFGDVAYELPANAFDLAAIAKDLDVASAELKLNVSVTKVDNPLAGKAAYKVLADAFDFNVSVVAPGGKSQVLNVFPTPIKRSVPAASELNPLTTVGVTVDANGNVTAVPTYVTEGKKSANLYRSTNSVYTLIEHSKSFTDITAGTSWAEEYVNPLASRMVVNGVTATEYAPTKVITRGEFAAILSRGLGIVAMDKSANVFADVSTSQAFNKNGEIAAVVEAGIVAGFTDGSFRPYEEITRDQAAIMISRAIDYVGADKVTFDTKKALTAFKDNKEIGAASRKHVERVYQAGLLDGYLDDTFRPNADANRAQMAKIIYNFLAEIKFIN
ncbi:S-layer homology domain-containing protein [Sporosarcina thermotolerans]|uniref:S-layer homology domain-containing protein n=1 Tax=Sporosarcina thermotolerans TaxID=633404 RepID=UPI0024BD1657|nr:S-layer homology domain-containing protein [Sporosarcina thermotolerans]WHT48287.1 S-layer homology domain-containing protein [Sporosarcina thermotolerans]